MMRQQFTKYISEKGKKTLPAFSAASGTMGTVADVMEPISPFAQYLYFLSLGALLILFIGALLVIKWRDLLVAPILFCLISATVSGALYYLQSPEQPEGVLASNIALLAKLQANLGIMEKSLAKIDKNTQDIASSNKDIAKHTENTAKAVEKLNDSLDKIIKGQSNGGILAEPKTAQDYYHNARLFELSGDYRGARQAYLNYFRFNENYIDPHLRYQSFLKIQEGHSGAREIYAEQFAGQNSTCVQFARLMLLPMEQRRERLTSFVIQHSDYTPAWYELSRLASERLLGQQTSADKLEEKRALEQVITLHQQGQWVKHYLDHELLNSQLEDVNSRSQALAVISEQGLQQSLSFTPSVSNLGFQINLQYTDTPKEIFYKTAEMADYQSTGQSNWKDPNTGHSLPNNFIRLPRKTHSPQVILAKYTDLKGNEVGPFEYAFNAEQHVATAQQEMLNMTKNAWLMLRDFNDETLVYFSQLATSRCAIKRIQYSLDSDKLDQEFALPPCDTKNPFSLPENFDGYIRADKAVQAVTVQVTFFDQTQSSVETYTK
ncbi:hypothetical protein K6Y31_13560 [Motilimonas cestriensis]|uniref:Uncharacterized protein n=1 Tax=Motilimonas cestriensis TaxID=2742685 RepID=A0ABS8WE47_9GAMM|nr:hypothetical protein [Motilimonas cestriensis]MCE2595834.1 hypothetical protein [Motilimonas cestriensis]